MLLAVWLFVGVVAILSTGVALATQTSVARTMGDADSIAIVSGIIGFIAWGYWSFGAIELEVVTDSGSTVTFNLPEIALLGVALAILPGLIALTGPTDLIQRARQPESREL